MKSLARLSGWIAMLLVGAQAQTGVHVGVGLDAPPTLHGNCHRVRVHFTGRINASAPGTVRYQWMRNDHRELPVRVLHFLRPGPVIITYDWETNGNSSGWAAFRVLSPVRAESRRVSFRADCRE